jgi:ribosomal protein S18 acetylase RimI-like enzyme
MDNRIRLRGVRSHEIRQCVNILLESEPWITLRWDRKRATKALRDGVKIGEVLVAAIGKEVAGFIVFLPKEGFPLGGYVRLLAVDERFRGMGIGKALLARAEREIFRHWPNVFLLVSSFNTSAQGFYQRLGYQRIGEITDATVRGHSEFIMRKTIGPVSEFKPAR